MRTLILHDYFLYKGGGERLIITLAKHLNADIATAFIAEDAFDPRDEGINTIQLYKEHKYLSKIPGFRYIQVNLSFLFKNSFMKDYDLIIHSGDTLTSLIRPMGKTHVAYMHTPPRHLFDSYQDRINSYGFLKKLLFVPYAIFNRFRWKWLSKRFDLIITNSETVQKRIKKYLKQDSVVVYPPCDAIDFKWKGQKDFYFSWARLYPAKRVDMIVKAFTKMPDKNLVVGSSGPELEKIKNIAEGHENIEIVGWITDEQLLDYLGNCIASIYIPVREDFGMTPVESMTAGKPCIGVNEGGLRETIIDGKTGILIKPDFQVDDIMNAVENLPADKALEMREACVSRAKEFSTEKFIDGMEESLDLVI
jgi:glycosyltransferase involved in cell wall biosynthesis